MAHVNTSIVDDVLSLPCAARVEWVELLLSSLDAPDKKSMPCGRLKLSQDLMHMRQVN